MIEHLLQRLVTWATITRDQDGDGFVQVDAGDPKPLEKVVQVGLPGAYAVATAGVKGILLRLLSNSLFVAADTMPPPDAVVREVGFFDGTALARLLPTHIFEVKKAKTGVAVPATGVLIGGGISLGATDGVTDGPVLQVVRSTDPVITPAGIGVGTCQGTTIRVGAA